MVFRISCRWISATADYPVGRLPTASGYVERIRTVSGGALPAVPEPALLRACEGGEEVTLGLEVLVVSMPRIRFSVGFRIDPQLGVFAPDVPVRAFRFGSMS